MDFENDAGTDATEGELTRIAGLVNDFSDITARRECLEDELKRTKEAERRYSEELIPQAMDEVGMGEITLADGTSVKIQEVTRASIAKKNREDAHQWLEDHGFGDLIKANMQLNGGRGEIEGLRELAEYVMRETQFSPSIDEAVHPQTLGAFVREQRAAGVELPHDLLGIFEGRVTKLTTK